jgi:acetyltransferase-like isoleucine patch superfamily enzyme
MMKKRKVLYHVSLFLGVVFSSPFFLFYKILVLFFGSHGLFSGFSQFLSLFPGRFGQILRRGFYFMTVKNFNPACIIDFKTFFPSDEIVIGKNVYIGADCIISTSIIEDDVIIGSGVHIANKKMHSFDSLKTPIRLQGGERRKIRIGHDCWIGNGAIILADVGAHCVIGAGSVVTKPVEDWSIAAGNPAHIIRKRK